MLRAEPSTEPRPGGEPRPERLLRPWALEAEAVQDALDVRVDEGLDEQEAARRLLLHGPNRVRAIRPRSALRILVDQLRSLVVALLAVAALASAFFGGLEETVAIVLVLVVNTAIGFATELRAVRSMDALRALGAVRTRARRAGRVVERDAEEIVPGDVLLLEGGDVVVADVRLVRASRLQADESTLTGEAAPVTKEPAALAAETRLDDRCDMLFKGTSLVRGSAEGVVVATGMDTELGRIYALTVEAESEVTPLEKRLDQLGRRLMLLTLAIAVAVVLVGLATGKSLFLMVETGIALAVATIPEGLPIVATIALARGLWRMARQNCLVNRISAVETLGGTGVLCTDKTGTLTENRMQVAELVLGGGRVVAAAPGHADGAAFTHGGAAVDPREDPDLERALEIGVLCNDAFLGASSDGSTAVGDPLETALLVAGARAGLLREALDAREPRVEELAFDSVTKRMATLHRGAADVRVCVKGAPETVLAGCTSVLVGGVEEPLAASARAGWLERVHALAGAGLRMLAVAEKRAASTAEPAFESLTLVGVVALSDPPREDVPAAIAACRRAGIRVLMLTGDHPATAGSIARAVGLLGPRDVGEVQSGERLTEARRLSAEERDALRRTVVFARVQPEQKLDLIRLHQEAGAVVGMIGDGVNDAPALRKADIGIAMGRRGTQVAREAADMVLTDDALASIVSAVREGRGIFRNIRRVVLYLLSCNLGEVLLVGSAAMIEAPLPVLPLQLLYLNLVSDVFPALALGVGAAPPGILGRPPRDPGEGILTRRHAVAIAGYSLVMTAAVLALYLVLLGPLAAGPERAVTGAFLGLAFAQLWHVFDLRPRGAPLWRNDVVANPAVWGALVLCTVLMLAAVYVPPLARVLSLARPTAGEWGLVLLTSLAPLLAGQVVHARARRTRRAGGRGEPGR